MSFQQRKDLMKPFVDYLNSGRANRENLLGLHASLQSMLIAVERKIKEYNKQQDKLRSRIKIDIEEEWLD